MAIRYLPNKKAISYGFKKKYSNEDLIEILGENLKLARRRRKFSMQVVAERAAINRATLKKIENGDKNVAIGKYVAVLRVFGLQEDLLLLAGKDDLGHKLQDLSLL